jgi:periplasmic protein TonB
VRVRPHRPAAFLPLLVATGCLLLQLPAGCVPPGPPATVPGKGNAGQDPPAAGLPKSYEDRPSPDDKVIAEEMPVILTPPRPTYPPDARRAGIDGVVKVKALVSRQGIITEAFVDEGHPWLSEAALQAVKPMTFRPAKKKGEPVAVWVVIPIRFSLH